MHTDDRKKFDIRNLSSNLQRGLITQKELDSYLSKLPDVSSKIDNPTENQEPSKGDQSRTADGPL